MKPQDFFIGVIDFFSVLLPGTLVTYFLMGIVYDDVIGSGKIFPSPDNAVVKWVFVLIVAYVIGHIIFIIGSFLDRFYNRFLRQFFHTPHDLAYRTARAVQWTHIDTDEELATLLGRGSISDAEYREISQDGRREIFNTYKWAQHFLLFKSTTAFQDIRRIEADQKFFRSLVVSLFVIAAVILLRGHNPPALVLIVLVLAALSLYRYADLRYKATQKAYELIITYFHLDPTRVSRPPTSAAPTRLKQALTDDFVHLHRETITALSAGFAKNIQRISFDKGDTPALTADRAESWYCLSGKGALNINYAGENIRANLTPHAIIPVAKGSTFSVNNPTRQVMEILVFEN